MIVCRSCRSEFPSYPFVGGVKLNLHGRKHCLNCKPLRHLDRPRRGIIRPRTLKACAACGQEFPVKAVIDGKMRSLYRRRFCLACSPFGIHNSFRQPPGDLGRDELVAYRLRRRNAKTYRYQKKRRRWVKEQLATDAGGRCIRCGYAGSLRALDFHHRDPSQKSFAISAFSGAWTKLLAEAQKCDLLCANCHRMEHAFADVAIPGVGVVAHRRKAKAKAVAHMGGACIGCGWTGPSAVIEFHHLDSATKDFGVGEDGIPRRWERVVAELANCVMLCANCHREVHAGVRDLDDGILGLAEDAVPYAA